MGVCGLHTTVAELDQSSVSAIVATRVGTDYIAGADLGGGFVGLQPPKTS